MDLTPDGELGHDFPARLAVAGVGYASGMDKHDANQPSEDNRERRPSDPPVPRGNPEADREAVERGEEQLEKVSGN